MSGKAIPTREEFVKHVKYTSMCMGGASDSEELIIETFDTLTIRADKAEAELAALKERTRWIPVSERLPEDEQEIYAHEFSGIITRFKYLKKLAEIFRRHYTHWQPLSKPQLPKE